MMLTESRVVVPAVATDQLTSTSWQNFIY